MALYRLRFFKRMGLVGSRKQFGELTKAWRDVAATNVLPVKLARSLPRTRGCYEDVFLQEENAQARNWPFVERQSRRPPAGSK